jgi:hypothetical protein
MKNKVERGDPKKGQCWELFEWMDALTFYKVNLPAFIDKDDEAQVVSGKRFESMALLERYLRMEIRTYRDVYVYEIRRLDDGAYYLRSFSKHKMRDLKLV